MYVSPREVVDEDEGITIHQNRTDTVDQNEIVTVHRSRKKTMGDSETDRIGENWSISAGQFKLETIGLACMQNVGLAKMVNMRAAYNVNVGAEMLVNMVFDRSTNVMLNRSVSVGQNPLVTQDAPGCQTRYQWDGAGNLLTYTDPMGNNGTRIHYYDGRGRRIQMPEIGAGQACCVGRTYLRLGLTCGSFSSALANSGEQVASKSGSLGCCCGSSQ